MFYILKLIHYFTYSDTVPVKNINEIVVDDSKLGSILNLDETPYFSSLNKESDEEKSSNVDVKLSLENTKIEDVKGDSKEEKFDDDLMIFNENKEDEEQEENKADTVDEYDSIQLLNSDELKNAEANINGNEDLSREKQIQSIIIAIQKFDPYPSIEGDSINDADTMANDLKANQLGQQNYELLSNEINMLSMRLYEMEKILMQSFQLNLIIILMFILVTSLVLFRVFFIKKRQNKIIFVGNRCNKMMSGSGEKMPLNK